MSACAHSNITKKPVLLFFFQCFFQKLWVETYFVDAKNPSRHSDCYKCDLDYLRASCCVILTWSKRGALRPQQRVGSINLPCMAALIRFDFPGQGPIWGSPWGQTCCPIKQRDLKTVRAVSWQRALALPRTMGAAILVVIETAGFHSLFISFNSFVPISWPEQINLNNRNRGSVSVCHCQHSEQLKRMFPSHCFWLKTVSVPNNQGPLCW